MVMVKNPRYAIDTVIRSDLYMGRITSAFYDGKEWCYGIGENASLEPTAYEKGEVVARGYRVGHKFIKESDIVAYLGEKAFKNWQYEI